MPTDPRVETIRLLTSIDATLKLLLAAMTNSNGAHASDADLDGQYGDPVVKAKDPKNWAGETMSGRKFSECTPAYLDQVADRAEHFAQKNAAAGDDKKAGYDRRDALRARGWAARLRAGWVASASQRVNTADSEPEW